MFFPSPVFVIPANTQVTLVNDDLSHREVLTVKTTKVYAEQIIKANASRIAFVAEVAGKWQTLGVDRTLIV